jgi:hypothetical protein
MEAFEARRLTARERDVLSALLGLVTPSAERLRKQLAEATVVGVCGCGCPSIYFAHDARGEGVEVNAEAAIDCTDDAVLLFVNSRGDLDSLEYMWISDSPRSEFPDASTLTPLPR